MVTHVVIFKWIESTTADQVDRLSEALDRMATEVSDLATIQHGADLCFRAGNGDYALVAMFADRQGWDAYQVHPTHKAFVREHVTPILANRSTIQF